MTVTPWKRSSLKMLIEQWKVRKGRLKGKQAFPNFLKQSSAKPFPGGGSGF